MREFLKSSGRRARDGWFWPLVLLALPNCALYKDGLPPDPTAFQPGGNPTDTVMCDIKVPETTVCAADGDTGISMSNAAVALFEGQHELLGLDFSPAAQAACGAGKAQKTQFQDAFPDGLAVCLNCTDQKPQPYSDGNAVCVAMCIDSLSKQFFSDPQTYCNTAGNAHVSTNFDPTACFHGLCTPAGSKVANFSDLDPRRPQELAIWVEQNGTKGGANGSSITRTAGRSGSFDAGAFSKQLITHGDGWVEFEVSDNTKAYAVGLSQGANDNTETLADFGFGFLLKADGLVYVQDLGGLQLNGPGPNNSFGPYFPGDRFRIRFVDKNDGAGGVTLTATRGTCTQGQVCNDTFLVGQIVKPAPIYPLRVDVSLVDPGAILQNVTMVRIQDLP